MEGSFHANGKRFFWKEIPQTNEYKQLLHESYGIVQPDVLRIWDENSEFDIAIRIEEGTYYPNTKIRYLGPVLVIGPSFPNNECAVQDGILIRLRPKLSRLPKQDINNAVAERIVQWALSSKFNAVRINVVGGVWVERA